MPDPAQFNTDRTHPAGWTITFSNPPINMFVPTTIVELEALIDRSRVGPVREGRSVPVDDSRFSSPISTYPRQLNGQRCWAFGAILCCASRPRQS